MKRASMIGFFISIVFTSSPVAAQLQVRDFSSKMAREAILEFEKSVVKSRKTFEGEMSNATDELLESLTRARLSETRAGNLQEAVKIDDAIKTVKKNERSLDANSGDSHDLLINKWKIEFPNGDNRYLLIYKNGPMFYAKRSKSKNLDNFDQGKIEFRKGKACFEHWEGKSMERYTVDADRLIVENWRVDENKSINRLPDSIGIAVADR